MKHTCLISILLSAALLASPSPAGVQDQEELPWFEIEIIIFTRDLNQASQSEEWPEYPGAPDWANTRPLQPGTTPGIQLNESGDQEAETEAGDGEEVILNEESTPLLISGAAIAPGTTAIDTTELPALQEGVVEEVDEGPQPPTPYALIPEEEYRLNKELKRLRRTGGRLTPVVHLAWRQPVTSRKQAELLYIQAQQPATDATVAAEPLSTKPPKLEGALRVSVNRYLHIDIDLLRREITAPTYSPMETFQAGEYTIRGPKYISYRMQARRRMRSGELHYIDHPLMGVLVQITPYELPEPIPEAETEENVQNHSRAEGESPSLTTEQAPPVTTNEGTTAVQPPADSTPKNR